MSTENKHFTNFKYYPWIIIALCSSLLFYKYILIVSPSIMVPDLMKQFHVTGAQLGSLAATFFYTYTIMQLFAGILLDKFGARFIGGFSILIAALGAYLFSVAESLAIATIARGLMGCGVAFATVTYFKMSAAWFRADQLAFVGGLLATAVMAGAVFGQAPLAWLLEHTNWRFILLL
jgi:MFS family permease